MSCVVVLPGDLGFGSLATGRGAATVCGMHKALAFVGTVTPADLQVGAGAWVNGSGIVVEKVAVVLCVMYVRVGFYSRP